MNKLKVLYEDNHIIVVLKKPNILSQGDITGDVDLLSLVKDYVKEKYNKPGNVYIGLVHRLDRPVGGVMVFARTSKAAARLSKQIQNHELKKKYLAIVNGIVKDDRAIFKDNLKHCNNGNTIISNDGKESILEYEVVDRNYDKDVSLVKIDLKTGRHHQIRVQFASRGYSLCGDQRYGKSDNTQIALFAYQLQFVHPVTKELMTFEHRPEKKGYWTFFDI